MRITRLRVKCNYLKTMPEYDESLLLRRVIRVDETTTYRCHRHLMSRAEKKHNYTEFGSRAENVLKFN